MPILNIKQNETSSSFFVRRPILGRRNGSFADYSSKLITFVTRLFNNIR